MAWFHGTTRASLEPGDYVLPAAQVGAAHPYPRDTRVALRSGVSVHPTERVWVCAGVDEAEGWGDYSCHQASVEDMRRMPLGGVAVYEVEPEALDYAVSPHSPTEAACLGARVVRLVKFTPFDFDA